MCVITLVETVRPSDEQIEQMWDQNPKGGGGAAWQDVIRPEEAAKVRIAAGTHVVRWRKGLDKKGMVAINKELPFPYVLHFRQPSHDTSESLLACHPFQVDAYATTGFDGVIEGNVLFHNGFWTDWRRKLEALALSSGRKLPTGAWSDSRGLAWAAHHLGLGILEMINEKVLCLGPGPGNYDIEMFGGPWLAVKTPDGGEKDTFVVSNRTWERALPVHVHDRRNETSRLLAAAKDVATGQTGKPGGASQQTPFPSAHGRAEEAAGPKGNQQEQVQEGAQGAVSGAVEHGTERPKSPLMGWQEGSTQAVCTMCRKQTSAGNIIMGEWFCWQCWSKNGERHVEEHAELWVGTCARCKVGSSGMKTVLGEEWLCHACWETNGKPKIYYARERGVGKTA